MEVIVHLNIEALKAGPIANAPGLHLDPVSHRWMRDPGAQPAPPSSPNPYAAVEEHHVVMGRKAQNPEEKKSHFEIARHAQLAAAAHGNGDAMETAMHHRGYRQALARHESWHGPLGQGTPEVTVPPASRPHNPYAAVEEHHVLAGRKAPTQAERTSHYRMANLAQAAAAAHANGDTAAADMHHRGYKRALATHESIHGPIEGLKARKTHDPNQLGFDFGAPAPAAAPAAAPHTGESPAARGLHLETVQVGGAHPHQGHRWMSTDSAADGITAPEANRRGTHHFNLARAAGMHGGIGDEDTNREIVDLHDAAAQAWRKAGHRLRASAGPEDHAAAPAAIATALEVSQEVNLRHSLAHRVLAEEHRARGGEERAAAAKKHDEAAEAVERADGDANVDVINANLAHKRATTPRPPAGFTPAKHSAMGAHTDGKGNYWHPGEARPLPAGASWNEQHNSDANRDFNLTRAEHHEAQAKHHEAKAGDSWEHRKAEVAHRVAAEYYRRVGDKPGVAAFQRDAEEASAAAHAAPTQGPKLDPKLATSAKVGDKVTLTTGGTAVTYTRTHSGWNEFGDAKDKRHANIDASHMAKLMGQHAGTHAPAEPTAPPTTEAATPALTEEQAFGLAHYGRYIAHRETHPSGLEIRVHHKPANKAGFSWSVHDPAPEGSRRAPVVSTSGAPAHSLEAALKKARRSANDTHAYRTKQRTAPEERAHIAKLDDKISALQAATERLGGQTQRERDAAQHFPLGAGSMRPTGERGGSTKRAEQRMDASIDRASAFVDTTRELQHAQAERAAYAAGQVNESGRSVNRAPKEAQPRRTITTDQKSRGVSKERAALEAAAWRKTHTDYRGWHGDAPTIVHRGGLHKLGDLSDDDLRAIAPPTSGT